jgi:MFS family permease
VVSQPGRGRSRLSADARRILAVQALRAFAYGLGSVLIGITLSRRGFSGLEVGVVLAALLAGTALVSFALARVGDSVGRRRCYLALLIGMGVAGTVFALTDSVTLLVVAALTGTVSTEVIESGPFTSVEQAMLPQAAADHDPTRLFGTYTTVATLAGSLGALGAVAVDVAYWFTERFGTSPATLGAVFLAVGFLQAISFQAAVRLAGRIGLLRTMVFTHLPSNVLLACIAFAPTEAAAIALLLARFALSQMDVPTRQAYVVAVVDPDERTAAAGVTNGARYVTRPVGPLLSGPLLGLWLGAPFVVAGALKSIYDVSLYRLFRTVELPSSHGGDVA